VGLKFYTKKKKKSPNNPIQTEQFQQVSNIAQIIDTTLLSFTQGATIPSLREFTDSDDWLNISPEQINDIILEKQREFEVYYNTKSQKNDTQKKKKEHYGKTGSDPLKNNNKEKQEQGVPDTMAPEDNLFDFMVKDMKQFMEKMSDIEGVQFDEEYHSESDEDDEFYGEGVESHFGEVDSEMQEVMDKMDKELSTTNVGQSFEKVSGDEHQVDINLNLVHNFLSSYEAQSGLSGPVTNLLNELHTHK